MKFPAGRAGRALAMAALGAAFGAAALFILYAVSPGLAISFDSDPPRLVSGVYPAERDEATGLTFAWTGREMALRLPGLDRRGSWVMEVRVRAARADAGRNPLLAFYTDGALIRTQPTATDFEVVRVTIPPRSGNARGAVISMQSSNTIVPGPHDARALGVMLDEVRLTPAGLARPPVGAITGAALGGAALGGVMALVMSSTFVAVAATAILSVAQAMMLTRGFAPYTAYPMTVATTAAWIAAALCLLVLWMERTPAPGLEKQTRFVLAFSAAALFLKLLVLLHPDMPVGDAMFHAHRFQGVLGGQLYFTSIAPGNYTFPYAPGFYLFAAPFAGLVTRGAAHMDLLRVIALSVDTIAGAMLYIAIRSCWNDRNAGVVAVVLYHALPLDFRVFTVGNLTNAFAQSVSVFALAMFATARLGRSSAVALLAFVLAVSFMSHTSTFPILFCTCVLVALLFQWKGNEAARSASKGLLVATFVALGLSIALYYAHFGEIYRSELARVSAETASAAPDAGGRGIGTRLGSVPMYLQTYFGAGALLLAAAGAWDLYARGARDRLTMTTVGWSASCVLFLALGVLTPVDMRYYLAAVPAVAIAGAAGLTMLWTRSPIARLAAAGLLGVVLWRAGQTWYYTF
jgi:hypothetical protein